AGPEGVPGHRRRPRRAGGLADRRADRRRRDRGAVAPVLPRAAARRATAGGPGAAGRPGRGGARRPRATGRAGRRPRRPRRPARPRALPAGDAGVRARFLPLRVVLLPRPARRALSRTEDAGRGTGPPAVSRTRRARPASDVRPGRAPRSPAAPRRRTG